MELKYLLLQGNTFAFLETLLENLVSVVPRFAGAIGVIIIGWILARVLSRLVKRLLASIKIDVLAEKLNEIDIVHQTNIKLVPSVLLSKIVYYLLMFFTFMAATDVLGMQAISDLMTNILNYIPKLLSALMVLVVGILIADFLKGIVLTTCQSLGIPAAGVIANVIFYFVFINVLMIALSQADLKTDFIENNISIVLAGVVFAFAIGYGLASRNLVANMIASFYNKEKVRIGDNIRIDGVEGTVIAMNNSTITLRGEGRRIVIPLSKLTSETIEVMDGE